MCRLSRKLCAAAQLGAVSAGYMCWMYAIYILLKLCGTIYLPKRESTDGGVLTWWLGSFSLCFVCKTGHGVLCAELVLQICTVYVFR